MIRKCRPLGNIPLTRLRTEAINWRIKNNIQISGGDKCRFTARTSKLGLSQNSDLGKRAGTTTLKDPSAKSPLNQRHRSQVLQFRKALFGEEPYDTRAGPAGVLKAIVAISGDAHNIATWLRGRKSRLKASDFNALQARFESLGGVMKSKKILDHIILVADNPAALKQRLLAHRADRSPDKRLLSLPDFSTLSSHIKLQGGDCLLGQDLRQKWLHIITGWSKNGMCEPAEPRAWCLYNLGPDLDASRWEKYADLLCMVGDSKELCSEWAVHLQKHGSNVKALNYTIQCLIGLGDPENAWRLAYESGDVAKSIQESTWELLLAHQQYFRGWIPEMNGPALRMLEKEICEVEKSLGLRWEGEEDGFHTLESVCEEDVTNICREEEARVTMSCF